MPHQNPSCIVIIGAGAAGFFSAIHNKLTYPKAKIIILEKSGKTLSKVRISGGGRCNVTHACFDMNTFSNHYPRGSRELIGPLHTFGPQDTIDWFENSQVALKAEKDNRVFPVSDDSQSIVDCLEHTAQDLGIHLWTLCPILSISKHDEHFKIELKKTKPLLCDKLILATGSNKQGYQFAKTLGHSIVPPIPSLFSFKINDPALHALQGVSVEDVSCHLASNKQHKSYGPIVITHWGLSGPAIIKLSSWEAQNLYEKNYSDTLYINWLYWITIKDILMLVLNHRDENQQRLLHKSQPFKFPQRLWSFLLQKANFKSNRTWSSLSNAEVNLVVQQLQHDSYSITGKGPFKEEFVTCGGVALNEINFKTMESKKCPNLHCIGELLNIDGVTGGFNFQNAWTTGYLSAQK